MVKQSQIRVSFSVGWVRDFFFFFLVFFFWQHTRNTRKLTFGRGLLTDPDWQAPGNRNHRTVHQDNESASWPLGLASLPLLATASALLPPRLTSFSPRPFQYDGP